MPDICGVYVVTILLLKKQSSDCQLLNQKTCNSHTESILKESIA